MNGIISRVVDNIGYTIVIIDCKLVFYLFFIYNNIARQGKRNVFFGFQSTWKYIITSVKPKIKIKR